MRTWLALALQSRRDTDRDPSVLRRRDREIATTIDTSSNRRSRVRAWLGAALDDEDRALLGRVDAGLRGLAILLTVSGLAAGIGTAGAVFRYDGTRPIDLLPALAVFAVLPLLLLLGFVVSALPSGVLRAIPGLRGLQENLLALASALASALLRVLPADTRDVLTRTFGEGRAHQRLFGRVQKWMLLAELQRFAVAFHVGAIAWFIARVFMTDLGFTWSATAEAVTPERLHALIETMAVPWSSLWPEAVPSLADVRATQYFRLAEGRVGDVATGATDPTLLSRWWTFVLAMMVTYGLGPRVLASWLSHARMRAAERWTIEHTPAALDALDRMDAPTVESRSAEPERTADPDAAAVPPAPPATGGPARLVVWADAAEDSPELRTALAGILSVSFEDDVARAGADVSFEDEARVADGLAGALPENGTAVVVVKAWEPATMDAVDFVRSLREALGGGRRIVVAARRLEGDGADVDQWRDRMKSTGDPWLRTVGFDLDPKGNA